MSGTHVVALSGGKDSTALALRLAEIEPRDYRYICTPTGNELPDMIAHWEKLECLIGAPIERVANRTLSFWIDEQSALPNSRMRWCTRMLKIEPFHAYITKLEPPITVYVGLRADEEDREGVIYGGPIIERYPMREWGWSIADVLSYLRQRGVKVPPRTDCAWCYDQRLSEWYWLWREQPQLYADAEQREAAVTLARGTPTTFRSPTRDSWPAGLAELRAEFARGRIPNRGKHRVSLQLALIEDDDEPVTRCRVCRL